MISQQVCNHYKIKSLIYQYYSMISARWNAPLYYAKFIFRVIIDNGKSMPPHANISFSAYLCPKRNQSEFCKFEMLHAERYPYYGDAVNQSYYNMCYCKFQAENYQPQNIQ